MLKKDIINDKMKKIFLISIFILISIETVTALNIFSYKEDTRMSINGFESEVLNYTFRYQATKYNRISYFSESL